MGVSVKYVDKLNISVTRTREEMRDKERREVERKGLDWARNMAQSGNPSSSVLQMVVVNCVASPTSRRRSMWARGVCVVTESDYA